MSKKKICLLMSVICLTPFDLSFAAPEAVRVSRAAFAAADDTWQFELSGEIVPALQLSRELDARKEADAIRRNLLRAEFKMLSLIGEQLEQRHGDGSLPAASENSDAPPPPASVDSPAPASASLPPAKPAEIVAAPALPRANEPGSGNAWLLAGGAASVALLVLLFMWRSRSGRDFPGETHLSEALTVLNLNDSAPPRPASAPSFRDEDLPLPLVEYTTLEALAEPEPVSSPDDRAVIELARILTSFGRDNGAAQALLDHLEKNPSGALQPWIRLLEIYRGNDMRQAFELLADHLNRSFNVELIRWDDAVTGPALELTPADLEKKRAMTLELYPHIRDQIDALWGREECLNYLQKLLRDNREGERNGFTFQVVQEIIFLTELMLKQKAAENAGTVSPS